MNRRIKKHLKKSTIRNIVFTHIENNIKEYFIVSVLFIVGIIIGVIFINNLSEEGQEEISGYFSSFITSMQNEEPINEGALLMDSILNNTGIALLIWLMGMAVIGIAAVYVIVIFRGFVLGYTIASAISFFGIGKGSLFIV
ncbi:MAG: stage II sporulation protein M, partial [Oscillospiraceae bacterium]|nr:stage II sporulation protein M [Oscillospiraceae bacterium]